MRTDIWMWNNIRIKKCSYGYLVVGIMKLVVLHYSQLTANDRSGDKWSGVNLTLSSPAYPPLSPTSGRRQQMPMILLQSVSGWLMPLSVGQASSKQPVIAYYDTAIRIRWQLLTLTPLEPAMLSFWLQSCVRFTTTHTATPCFFNHTQMYADKTKLCKITGRQWGEGKGQLFAPLIM